MKAKTVPADVPFYTLAKDGVTFSMLSQFLTCRERCRIGLQGWSTTGTGLGMLFGTVVHAALQELYTGAQMGRTHGIPSSRQLDRAIVVVDKLWRKEHPIVSAESMQMYERAVMLAQAVLPHYVRYWHADFTELTWRAVESEFRVLRETHTGLSIPLRGKMDGAYTRGKKPRPWLFETKTKGHISEAPLADIMPHELQVNIYLNALQEVLNETPAGVLYNIVRRPQLRERQGETWDTFVKRVSDDVAERPDWYFVRMEMSVDADDLIRFSLELKDLITDFVAWWGGMAGHYKNSGQCQNMYGTCPALAICARQDFSRWFKRDRVFLELGEW